MKYFAKEINLLNIEYFQRKINLSKMLLYLFNLPVCSKTAALISSEITAPNKSFKFDSSDIPLLYISSK